MGRMERFAGYTFSDWPDEGLNAAIRQFARHPSLYVQRVEQRLHHVSSLIVDLTDENYGTDRVVENPAGGWMPDPNQHQRVIRLTWEGHIYALETYDEFYSAPFGVNYSWRKNSVVRHLHEIANEPDPWIEELLADNPHTGTFPMSDPPIMARADTLARNPGMSEPTGRFYRPHHKVGGGIDVLIHPTPTTPQELAETQAEAARLIAQREAGLRAQPRYRHLFIASATCMVEVLCDRLPTWEWVDGD